MVHGALAAAAGMRIFDEDHLANGIVSRKNERQSRNLDWAFSFSSSAESCGGGGGCRKRGRSITSCDRRSRGSSNDKKALVWQIAVVRHSAGRRGHNDDGDIRGSRGRLRQNQWPRHREDGSGMGVVVSVDDATE